jgi:hypothetical protein
VLPGRAVPSAPTGIDKIRRANCTPYIGAMHSQVPPCACIDTCGKCAFLRSLPSLFNRCMSYSYCMQAPRGQSTPSWSLYSLVCVNDIARAGAGILARLNLMVPVHSIRVWIAILALLLTLRVHREDCRPEQRTHSHIRGHAKAHAGTPAPSDVKHRPGHRAVRITERAPVQLWQASMLLMCTWEPWYQFSPTAP